MNKLMNNADAVVRESLEGRALLQPGLALLGDGTTVILKDRFVTDENRKTVPVALLSGGGAGHEPAHAGYVADGMLTAAVSGGVFSSPSVDAVLDGIRAVTGDAGCLLIVKSYTGDRLNFGMAAELARAEGLNVAMVVVGDDVALGDDDTHAGRRGLAGTVFVHKTAGAAAASGKPLEEVAKIAQTVADAVGTMGVGLSACTVPGASKPGFTLDDGEMELGLGIHGEPGVERRDLATADEIAAILVDRIAADRKFEKDTRIVALVGAAGATPPSELDILTRSIYRNLNMFHVERLWAGNVMTSLDMAGASLSLLEVDDATLALLDKVTASPAWPGTGAVTPPESAVIVWSSTKADTTPTAETNTKVRAIIDAICEKLLAARAELDEADQHVGDGDLGSALARGAKAWLDEPGEGDAAELLEQLSAKARRDIGGTSGPLYGMLLLRAAQSLKDGGTWAGAFTAGVKGVQELGGAEVGEGTMVDALVPAAKAATSGSLDTAVLDAVVEAAQKGADSTAEGASTKGRASYIGERAHGYPDPGATAVAMWLGVIRDGLTS